MAGGGQDGKDEQGEESLKRERNEEVDEEKVMERDEKAPPRTHTLSSSLSPFSRSHQSQDEPQKPHLGAAPERQGETRRQLGIRDPAEKGGRADVLQGRQPRQLHDPAQEAQQDGRPQEAVADGREGGRVVVGGPGHGVVCASEKRGFCGKNERCERAQGCVRARARSR